MTAFDPNTLTGPDKELWDILTTEHEREDYEDFGGYPGYDTFGELEQVAAAITDTYLSNTPSPVGEPRLAFECNTDGDIEWVTVSCFVHPTVTDSFYVSNDLEVKNCTDDRQAVGELAALCYARALSREFARVYAAAQRVAATWGTGAA